MPVNFNSDNFQNNDFSLVTDNVGDLVLEHKQTGGQFKFDATSNSWVPVQGLDMQGADVGNAGSIDGNDVTVGSATVNGTATADALEADELTGVADYVVTNTSELESAFENVSQGDTIYIGRGDFTPSTTLSANVGGVTIIGSGRDSTTIKNTTDQTLLDLSGTDTKNTVGQIVRNLRLDGDGYAGTLLDMSYTAEAKVEDAHWRDASAVGVLMKTWTGNVLNCVSHNCDTNLKLADDTNNVEVFGGGYYYDPGHTTSTGTYPIIDVVGGSRDSSDNNQISSVQVENRSTSDPCLRIGTGTDNEVIGGFYGGLGNAEDCIIATNITDDPVDTTFISVDVADGVRYGLNDAAGARRTTVIEGRYHASGTDIRTNDGDGVPYLSPSTEYISKSGTWRSTAPITDPIDKTGSRSLGVWYKNTTGDKIEVTATVQVGGGDASADDRLSVAPHVNDTESDKRLYFEHNQTSDGSFMSATATMTVPSYSYYKVDLSTDDSGAASLNRWWEQRFV